ncbi:MAG TPA: serine acetyltransferase [Rhodocyclaceae bacterium]|nr:serine acetyltransferase [Rhodocyclaceae bacterium]
MNIDMQTSFAGDVWRLRSKASWGELMYALATQRSFKAIFTLRLCQATARAKSPARFLLPLCQILHRLARHLGGMDLPWQTQIGSALSIQHGWGMVINKNVHIGSNVTLYHGVTIGQGDRIDAQGARSTGYPVIEDEVWIGPHAIVVGDITIGRGSRILGGAFVTRSVPPFSLVIGNPGEIRRTVEQSDVFNRYPNAIAGAHQLIDPAVISPEVTTS